MATVQQVITQQFDLIKLELIEKYREKGMRASGKFEESLEVITTTTNAKIIGEDYTQQLEDGRRPGKFPPIAEIKQWIIDKGIVNQIKGEITISSLAFLIARKISKQGWKRKDHGGVNLVSEVITDKRIQEIIDLVGQAALLDIIPIIETDSKTIITN